MFQSITFHSNPYFGYSATFILVSILCEFAMLRDVYILLFAKEEELHSSSSGTRWTHLAAHSSKRLNPLPVIILVCLDNTQKNKNARQAASSLVLLVCRLLIVIDKFNTISHLEFMSYIKLRLR